MRASFTICVKPANEHMPCAFRSSHPARVSFTSPGGVFNDSGVLFARLVSCPAINSTEVGNVTPYACFCGGWGVNAVLIKSNNGVARLRATSGVRCS